MKLVYYLRQQPCALTQLGLLLKRHFIRIITTSRVPRTILAARSNVEVKDIWMLSLNVLLQQQAKQLE